MAGSGEVLATQVALTEGEDAFNDDPRGDGKKKKFKPFQKMRNFFRGGSSKKRFKVGEVSGDSVKSQSTGALHSQGAGIEDEDDDGGFGRSRKSAGLAGSRSISEDSIFKPDTQKEAPAPVGVLVGQAVSMERINSDFQSELFSKLRGRQSDSDIDEGLPYSPNPNSNIFDAAMKKASAEDNAVITANSKASSTIGGKSVSQDSEQSLISVDGSEEDLFDSNWTSGVASVKQAKSASTGSTESLDKMEVSDFEAVQMRTGKALSSDAAKHRISVKPKTRRLSSKKSIKSKEKPSVQTNLPNVTEEPVLKSPVKEIKQEEQIKPPVVQHKTVISTTIPVGNLPDSNISSVPRSEPKDIPQPRKGRDDLESGRMSRSLSPLSTSPVSQSILQDVKLRSRPLSGKFEHVETKVEENKSELSQAFNKAKRFSRKYDSDGKIIDTNVESVKPVVKSERTAAVGSKPEVTVNKTLQQKDDTKKDLTVSVLSSSNKDTTASNTSPSPQSGVSYVLKKEPLRPGTKPTETSKPTDAKIDSVKQSDSGTTVSIVTKTEDDTPKKSDLGTKSVTISTGTSVTQTVTSQTVTQSTLSPKPAVSQKTGSPEKLPSPREEYRLKRQNRSKTLPVSKELVDKAEELESANQKPNRARSPPVVTSGRTTNYDNVVIGPKPLQPKRMSWASTTGTTATAEPPWVTRKLKEKENDKQGEAEKKDTPKEIKIEVKGTVDSKPVLENKTSKSPEVVTDTKQSIEKTVNQPVKSWAKTVTAKPFEKPVVESTTKPVQSSTVKPFSQSMRGNISTQSYSQKPPVPSSTKPFSQSVRPSYDSKAPNLGSANKTSGFERSFTQKTTVNKPVVEAAKPVSQPVKPLGNVNTNNTKSDTKDSSKPNVGSVSDSRKMFLNQENKKIEIESKSNSTSQAKSVFERSKGGTPASKPDTNVGMPEWKKNLKKNLSQQVNIEIIDKDPEVKKPEVKKPENKVEEKSSVALRDKPKTTPEKCSDNRSSKVLDMVKSFQKLQVT